MGKTLEKLSSVSFDWAKAFHLNSRVSWLARNGNVLDRYRRYIFAKNEEAITILPDMSEFFYTNLPILIVTHIKISKAHYSMEVVDHLFEALLNSFSGQFTAMLLPKWTEIGASLQISKDEMITFMHNHGIVSWDDQMMFRYMDNSIYNELEIKRNED